MASEPGWWWLSFAGDSGFLGGAIVGPAKTFEAAIQLAHRLKCNPGGEVQGKRLPDAKDVDEKWCNKLLSHGEIAEMDREKLGDKATGPVPWNRHDT